MQRWQSEWEAFNHRAAEPRQRAEVQQSRIQHLEQVQQRLLERIERLKEEKTNLHQDSADEEIAELNERLAELDTEVEAKRAAAETIGEQLENQRSDNNRLADELDAARSRSEERRVGKGGRARGRR